MKRVWMVCGLAVAAALMCACVMAGDENKPATDEAKLVGMLKCEKDDAGKVTAMKLTVVCKPDCAGCDKDTAYAVTAGNEEVGKKLAELDGKKVMVKGKVAEAEGKKTITVNAVQEAKEKKEKKEGHEAPKKQN